MKISVTGLIGVRRWVHSRKYKLSVELAIKKLFTPKRQYPDIKSVKPLTKGDLKKLKAAGKIAIMRTLSNRKFKNE